MIEDDDAAGEVDMSCSLVVSRELFVPRELVFDVWTYAEHLENWYSPGADFERHAEVDAGEGGAYLLTWTGLDGRAFGQRGRFETVDPPEALAYTSVFEVDGEERFSTRTTVRFTDLGGGTRIDIVVDGYPDGGARDSHQASWPLFLDQLEAYFSVI
ncbi:MAG: hypothetical protein GWM88_08080 [Pseudomonadales bacterium]|nr:SRPBCC domain-containing protein [Pseudomonadales bacterium]NIX07963.1 hypothetical protein [Pseudomonadales bacterium]